MFTKNKKAAIELSMTTVVVLVLAVLMLGLGIVLIKTIFKTSTESVNTIDAKIQQELNRIISDEQKDVVVMLGPDRTARVKPDTNNFGVAVAARTPEGELTSPERLRFKLTLDTATNNNCLKKLGQSPTENMFITSLNTLLSADQTDASTSYLIIQLKVPKGTPICTQKVFVDVTDSQTNKAIGRNSFIIEVLKPGLF